MATFHFYGSLTFFLPKRQRDQAIDWPVREPVSVKDVIESLGVPHPEIGRLVINGESAAFTHRLQPDDQCDVYPHDDASASPVASQVPAIAPPTLRFVLDTHLGKLATYLRLLGFDTLYRNTFADDELARLSSEENRILLTRDRALLMRRVVEYGYYVRHTQPTEQLQELRQRYRLNEQRNPFSRCLVCNGELVPVSKETVEEQLPPHVRTHQQAFWRCKQCNRIYWEGSHYQRMRAFVDSVFETDQSDAPRHDD